MAPRWRQFTESQDHLDADHEYRRSLEDGGTPIAATQPRTTATWCGSVRSVVQRPYTQTSAFEVELYDGTATARVVWWGRRAVAGVVTGCRLRVTGRATIIDHDIAMYNPAYELIVGPL